MDAPPSPSRVRAEWPLIGREAELAFAREALTGQSAGVVLAGEAGVGKSRLAHEALAEAASSGAHVERVRATRSAASTALGPFAHLLRAGGHRPSDHLDLLLHAATAVRARAGQATDPQRGRRPPPR